MRVRNQGFGPNSFSRSWGSLADSFRTMRAPSGFFQDLREITVTLLGDGQGLPLPRVVMPLETMFESRQFARSNPAEYQVRKQETFIWISNGLVLRSIKGRCGP
jgi:hypothetical protein